MSWAIQRRGFGPTTLLLVALSSLGCDKDDAAALGDGEAVSFEVAGLRSIIERHAAAAGDRLLVAGRAGRDLHGRMLWASSDGSLLLDREFAAIRRPEDVTACIDGQDADVYWITREDDASQLYTLQIRDDQLVEPGDSLVPTMTSSGILNMKTITGLEQGCGVCLFDTASGQLSCQLGAGSTEPRTWQTGPLGDWSVLELGEDLVVADWGADEEGWLTVRITPLRDTDPAAAGWLHSYRVGQLPSIADPAEQAFAHPAFLPADDHVKVVFVDGTDWFTRLFVQRFSLHNMLPDPPQLLESCRGTCKIRWSDSYDDANWIWFQDQNGDWAIRVDDSETPAREGFNPPPNVEALDGGYFKMGLGNDVANWWALVEYEVD